MSHNQNQHFQNKSVGSKKPVFVELLDKVNLGHSLTGFMSLATEWTALNLLPP